MRRALVLALAMLAAGCAAPPPPKPPAVASSLFVVVPASDDGHVGKIVVTRNGESRLIETAYAGERVKDDGSLESVKLSEPEVRAAFGPTLEALPGRPASFVVYFLEGRDELTPESRAELDKVLAELRRRPLPDIVVIGHTDTVGGLTYNDRLSLARAERVRAMMVQLGIPAERIEAAGRGEREPLVPTDDNTAEPRNRRVEINVR